MLNNNDTYYAVSYEELQLKLQKLDGNHRHVILTIHYQVTYIIYRYGTVTLQYKFDLYGLTLV